MPRRLPDYCADFSRGKLKAMKDDLKLGAIRTGISRSESRTESQPLRFGRPIITALRSIIFTCSRSTRDGGSSATSGTLSFSPPWC